MTARGSSKYPAAQLAAMRQDWLDGFSGSKIGRKYGMTKNAVIGLANRQGWPSRGNPIYREYCPRRIAPKVILPVLPSLAAVESKPVATIREAKQAELRLPTSKRSCQFIESDDRPWQWCCRPALFGKSWCGQHYRVVFTPASRKEAA